MKQKVIPFTPPEYQVGGTKYTVVPVYEEHANKDTLENKILRLIFSDKEQTPPQP